MSLSYNIIGNNQCECLKIRELDNQQPSLFRTDIRMNEKVQRLGSKAIDLIDIKIETENNNYEIYCILYNKQSK